MRSFSFGRVAQYARYHYTAQQKNYLSLAFAMFAMPAVMAILARDITIVPGMALAIYLFGSIGYAVRTTFAMRERSTKILETTMPVSNEERFCFMFFNLAVVYPLLCLITASLALVVVYPFSYSREIGAAFSEMMYDGFLEWGSYVLVQIICASSLLINLLARRNLFVAYLGAFAGVIAFFAITGRAMVEILDSYAYDLQFVDVNVPEGVAVAIFCSVPVIIYALCYWALRRRQMKW